MPDRILLPGKGVLLNGQHRLHVLVQERKDRDESG